jgi:hypothetical protein
MQSRFSCVPFVHCAYEFKRVIHDVSPCVGVVDEINLASTVGLDQEEGSQPGTSCLSAIKQSFAHGRLLRDYRFAGVGRLSRWMNQNS